MSVCSSLTPGLSGGSPSVFVCAYVIFCEKLKNNNMIVAIILPNLHTRFLIIFLLLFIEYAYIKYRIILNLFHSIVRFTYLLSFVFKLYIYFSLLYLFKTHTY